MKSYVESVVATAHHHALLELATRLFQEIPQLREPGTFRCHEIARVFGDLLELPVQDGVYGHSWCWSKKLPVRDGEVDHDDLTDLMGSFRIPILDCYAFGRLPPVQLVYAHFLPGIYREVWKSAPPRQDIDYTLVQAVVAALGSKVVVWKKELNLP